MGTHGRKLEINWMLRLSLIHRISTLNTPVVIINGLPGTGKSTLLKQLAMQRNQQVFGTLPNPTDVPVGELLIWDPAGQSFQLHLQQVMELISALEQRSQTLIMSAAWVGETQWLTNALLYEKITLVEQRHLMLTEHDISETCPHRDAQAIWRDTRGWAVLAANWEKRGEERIKHSWNDFVRNRIMPLLPFHEQRLLVALGFETTLHRQSITTDTLHLEALEPLIELTQHSEFALGIPFLRPILQTIAKQETRLYQDAMRLVSRHYYLNGERVKAITSALQSNHFDLALRWFNESGGGVYGYHHGFDELEDILHHFPTMLLNQELPLAWANVILLFKRQKFLAARSFIEHLPQQNKIHFESDEERGIFTLIKSKYFAYFRSNTEAEQLNEFTQLESWLVNNPSALMNYYGTLSIYHSNIGEWFKASLLLEKELQLATQYKVPYLAFFCHFNMARLNLRVGYPQKSAHHIEQAEIALKRTTFRSHLSYELNFVTLAQGMIALNQGDIHSAQVHWKRVSVLRQHSEIWPEFLSQIHLFGITTKLLTHDIEGAALLLDELRYEYFSNFADDHATIFYRLLTVLILQQQERWVEALQHLDAVSQSNFAVAGNYRLFHQWLKRRNQVGLICIHQQKGANDLPHNELFQYPYNEIQFLVQDLKLYWHKRDYQKLTRPAIDLLQRCHQLTLWSPLLLEQHWLNSALNWIWNKEKYRYTNTSFELAYRHWQKLYQPFGQTQSIDELTNRQLQIILRLAEGLSNKQIAQYCGISESTVKFHLKNLFKTYEIKNRQDLLGLARIKGWIQ